MPPLETAERLGLLIALAFFLGLAFEEVYKRSDHSSPGGVRTFPIVSLIGAALYLVDQTHALAFVAGLLALGAWLYRYLAEPRPSFIVPATHLLAYALGAVALSQSLWLPVSLTVVTVLFLTARTQMHRVVEKIPQDEILTAGQFLILVGVILPITPNEPLIPAVPMTPFHIWLAVVVVSATAYLSYLVERYVPAHNTILLPAVMGGFYSSTAITVVLAKRLREGGPQRTDVIAGIVAATSVMYIRIGIIVALFDRKLALQIAGPLAAFFLGTALIALWEWRKQPAQRAEERFGAGNPLQMTAALTFAVSYVIVTLVSNWVRSSFGAAGMIGLALVVGLTDIAPFVSSVAQGSVSGTTADLVISAILTAASSNNLLKAGYALSFGGRAGALRPATILAGLGVLGFVAAALIWFARPFT